MTIIDKKLLDTISLQALKNERLRMNYNLHESENDAVQRLLNALEVGTKIPVHRHLNTDETYIILRGKLRIDFYNKDKKNIGNQILDTKNEIYGINIPAGTWHSLEVLESAVILEVKQGPYTPLDKENILE